MTFKPQWKWDTVEQMLEAEGRDEILLDALVEQASAPPPLWVWLPSAQRVVH